jgi:hypothetical protein
MFQLFRKTVSTESVFGVSNSIILSYIERDLVDKRFNEALSQDKEIIIYGSSKQGKTSLLKKHLDPNKYLTIECTPSTKLIDIYTSILRQCDVQLASKVTKESLSGTEGKFAFKASVNIPLTFSGEASIEGSKKEEDKSTVSYTCVDYNLALAQSIIEILNAYKNTKYIVLENFHYLNEDEQRAFSFDLRTFQDANIAFIILGIWRERNRLSQYNGDLQDRLIEIPVEPWGKDEFIKVLKKGETALNVSFKKIQTQIIDASFDSIGVLQELAKYTCFSAGVNKSQKSKIILSQINLDNAKQQKLEDYSTRHIKSFEAFIDNTFGTFKTTLRSLTTIEEKRKYPLYIPNYFLIVLLNCTFNEIESGLERKLLHDRIQEIHYRPEDVRPSDMSNFLHKIVASQISNKITPPLFDYDIGSRKLKVIDSTLYFFLRHSDHALILSDLDL